MTEREIHPPEWSLRLLRTICPPHLLEEIEGDLMQRFERDLNTRASDTYARLRFIWNTIRFFRPGIILRNGTRQPILQSFINTFQLNPNFRATNNFIGWIVFCIAFLTYSLTVEETASYWDCSEFIAASYKLQVPHPPGAPLFLLVGRVFSFLALGNVTKLALAINMMSVFASAFTVLFLFWSIVLIGRKMMGSPIVSQLQVEKKWLLIGAGAVGALAFAFSDSFWFSAVEAEVYAMSSFFTALVVWAILKWDMIEDKSKATRWLLLIAYIIGLSIGVHLLNLLTLPALSLIFYFRTFKTTRWGILTALTIGASLILLINDLIIPGLPSIAGKFEIFFVNSLGLFFGSGVIVFAFLVVGTLSYGIYYTHWNNRPVWNTILLATTFILIGYGSYSSVVIRSNLDPPLNENAPDDVMSFVSYLKREQYGSRPLLYGPYFTSEPVGYSLGVENYRKGKDKYEATGRDYSLEYKPGEETLLPRAWNPEHKDAYRSIIGLREGQQPSFVQNISYLLQHQVGTMYARYFMWNFAGRESDMEGAGWIKPVDWFKKVPSALASNKARNNFFMIPFLLGLIGMFFHFVKDTKSFLVVALLFAMLGVAIVIYLNSPPVEPRERDYIYTGSYYAFAFWIGLSVIGIGEALKSIKRRRAISLAATLIGFSAPVIMLLQGWDDHDRSNRFFSVDSAANSLVSCEPNGIIFTGGDNDTFPLWYAQDAEGCRTDLRVLVLSYCKTDWYIDQTLRKTYQSEPVSYTLGQEDYCQGGLNDILPFVDVNIKSIDAREYLNLLARKFPGLQNEGSNIIPSRVLALKIDKASVLGKGIIPKGMESLVVDQMEIRMTGNRLEKNDLVFLDLLVTSNWERPVYLNPTSLAQLNFDMSPYAVQEGNTYRILPVKNPRSDRQYLVNADKTYDLMLKQFRYRGLDDEDVYYNDDYKIPVLTHRSNFNSLAQALIDEGDEERARKALLFSLEKMPGEVVPYDPSAPDTVDLLLQVGEKEKALEIATVVGERATEMASYLVAEDHTISMELRQSLFMLGAMRDSLLRNNENMLATRFDDAYTKLLTDLQLAIDAGRMTN